MRRTILTYGALAGVLIAVLELMQYRYLVVEHAFELYGALVALIFAAVGIWIGLRLTQPKVTVLVKEVPVEVPVEVHVEVPIEVPVPTPVANGEPFFPNVAALDKLGITPRELEILQLIAQGLSTKEIADRENVSENTVKTHTSRLLDKLDAKRRTQAVQRAKEAGLIP